MVPCHHFKPTQGDSVMIDSTPSYSCFYFTNNSDESKITNRPQFRLAVVAIVKKILRRNKQPSKEKPDPIFTIPFSSLREKRNLNNKAGR